MNDAFVNDIKNIAIIMARIAHATIQAQGMVAENQRRALRQEHPAYTQDAFEALLVESGIDQNSVMHQLYDK